MIAAEPSSTRSTIRLVRSSSTRDRWPGLQKGGGQGAITLAPNEVGALTAGCRPAPAAAAQRRFGDGDLPITRFCFVKTDPPGVGEALASGVTLQQTRRQLGFQLGDISRPLPADSPRRDAAPVKLPHSTTAINVSIPRSLSILLTSG